MRAPFRLITHFVAHITALSEPLGAGRKQHHLSPLNLGGRYLDNDASSRQATNSAKIPKIVPFALYS